MTSILLTNIGELTTWEPQRPQVPDAALVVEGGRVAWSGSAASAPAADTAYDAGGRAVVPGFVDSHSHLVFAGDRSAEFAARMSGEPYAAGGIRTTVSATRAASDEALAAVVADQVVVAVGEEVRDRHGTDESTEGPRQHQRPGPCVHTLAGHVHDGHVEPITVPVGHHVVTPEGGSPRLSKDGGSAPPLGEFGKTPLVS